MRNFFRMPGVVAIYILLGISVYPAIARGQTVSCTFGCITTHQYDNSRSNTFSGEAAFKASNGSTWWNALTTDSVTNLNGTVYAQPLFLSELAAEPKEILYVATEENWVYALSALNLSSTPYWSVNLDTRGISGDVPVPSADLSNGTCADIYPETGITGTPVIDLSGNIPNVLYVVTTEYNSSSSPAVTQRLHALNIFTGADVAPYLDIATAYGGTSYFSASYQNQRPALALTHDSSGNPLIYVAWASNCDQTSTPPATYTGKAAVFTLTGGTPALSLVAKFDVTGGVSGAVQRRYLDGRRRTRY